MPIQRLYTFQGRTKASSAQMNAELDQLVEAHNTNENEIVVARGTYNNLNERLNNDDGEIGKNSNDLKDRGVNIKDFDALGGANNDSTAIYNAVTYAINNGYNSIYLPFSEITLGTSVDFKGLIVRGNGTVINGTAKNVKAFKDCSINGFDYDSFSLNQIPHVFSVSPKLVACRGAGTYYVITKKAGSQGYLFFIFKRGVTTTTNSTGAPSELLRLTGVQNVLDAYCYNGTYSAIVGTWSSYQKDLFSPTAGKEPLYFWQNTSKALGDSISFDVDIDKNGEFTLGFLSSAASDPAAKVTIDGVTVSTVNLTKTAGNVLIKKISCDFTGRKTVKVETSGAFTIYCAGSNFTTVRNAKPGNLVNKYAYWRDSNDYIYNEGAVDYAMVNADDGLYYGSYHGGESKITESIKLDGQEVSLVMDDFRICESFSLDQVTSISTFLTSNTSQKIVGDGVFEFMCHMVGDVNVTTFYTCLTTTNEAFTRLLFPRRISTDGADGAEYSLGRVTKIVQENPTTGQRITTLPTIFRNDNNNKGGVFIRRAIGAYNKVYYGKVVSSLDNIKDISFQTVRIFE